MADYYPLLARALDALPDRTPAMRRAVYDRARNALVAQLRSIDPPLSEDDIDTERRALDAAITRLEATYDIPAAANDPDAAPAVAPAPAQGPAKVPEPPPAVPSPEPPVQTPAPPPPVPGPAAFAEAAPPEHPAEPFLPPAPPPHFVPMPAEPPREPAIAIAAPRPPGEAPPPSEPEPVAAPEPAATPEIANGRQRPRIDVVAPRNRSRLLRNAFVGVVLTCVIGAIAVAAYLLRDRPTEFQAAAPSGADSQPESGDAKFADRVGGEPAPAERATPAEGRAPAQGAGQAPAQPDLAVAQRATLLEEGGGGPDAQPVTSQGRVLWRLESVSGEQGQPLQTAIVATITIPDALTLTLTIQRNLDATLPASHTVSLAFSPSGPEASKRTVQDVGLLQAKDDEGARGSPLSGLPVRVRENLFLIGLSSLRNDVDRNTDLLLHRNWFDLGLRYANGQRAVVTFEKGNTGAQVMQRAFEQWR